ncbi:uncharacterized protein [Dysidea avara]|uniref:uncharacterized protein n=1 Tax=Dysidea avara TaxID=196820 RepID=UPI00331C122B
MADGSANPAGHSSSSQCTESEDSRGEIERQLHEDVLLYLQEQRYRQECTKNEKRCIRRKAMRYTLEDGALLYTKQDKTKVRYILDPKEKERILRGCHVHPTSGHMGTKKTQARITERYMWQGVGKDVKAFLFMQFGLPRVITSDQGSEFNNCLDKKLMKMMKIDHCLTTPYHPQANGLVERFNQTIQNMLVKFVNEKKELWEDYLDTCVFAYNTSKHESSKYCPFAVMFG